MRTKLFSPSTWSLKVQLALCLVLFLVFLTQIASQIINRSAEQTEIANLKERSHHTVLLTSSMISLSIEEGDLGMLEEFLGRTILHDPNVSFVSVTRPNGEVILDLGDPSTIGQAGYLTISDPILFSTVDLGNVSITWDTAFIDEIIDSQIRQTRVLLDSFLAALGLLVLIGWQFLVIRPLTTLDQRIQALRGGEHIIDTLSPLTENQSREWSQLSLSTNLLQEAIIQQEQRELELKVARDNALQTAEIKSNILTNVSHELRTPLNGILGLSELLKTTELDEEQRDYADSIAESGDDLLEIIEGIMNLSSIENGELEAKPEACDLIQTVHDVVEGFRPAAEGKGLKLSFQNDSWLPSQIDSDQKLVHQAMTHLIDNAIRFTEKGVVAVALSGTRLPSHHVKFQIDISDTGIGIPADQLDQIFDSFTQVDGSLTRAQDGNGLGLTLSKGIAETLGGEISVQSDFGIGSTFTLKFEAPIAETQASPQEPISEI